MFANSPILLGQYRPLDSFLHRLDARAKIFPVTLVLVLALMTDSALFYLACEAALVGGLLLSGVGARVLARNFRPILILVGITAFYHVIFSGGETPVVWSIGGVTIREGALTAAWYFSLRLVLFVSVAFLITLTNSPSELAEAFGQLLRPLGKLRIPVQDIALILFMALRFIPVLYEEFTAIRNAQLIRGVDFSGSLMRRIRKTVYVIIPVFVAAVQRADDLAMAITARGYDGSRYRTFYTTSSFGWSETAFLIGVSAFVFGLFWVTRG